MSKRKSLQERKAWDWAFSTNLDQILAENVYQAYRVTAKSCKPGSCRTNCKGNPNCLNCLGEATWMKTTADTKDSSVLECVKQEDGFCGLRNLGATCYVNSLLQVWFFDVCFREAVYAFTGADISAMKDEERKNNSLEQPLSNKKPKLDPGDEDDSSEPSGSQNSGTRAVTSIKFAIGQLQLLFTHLQSSKRRVIDTNGFVDSLHLQHDRQQDAQEFRKLFLSQVSCAFQAQPSMILHACVESLYEGSYWYKTRCMGCGQVSGVESPFYELELRVQDCPTLTASLEHFFKHESLNGDNQYYCTQCSSKMDAKRYIELKSLPPILTLQMLRFVFDMSLLAKVKVTSHLTFPDELDLSHYIGHPTLYQLSSLILHCGPSAYAGHYIAYVRDHKTGKWWCFDDDIVEVYKDEKLILCSDEDSIISPQKRRRCPKGSHMSNNVYMLVYKSKDQIKDDLRIPEVPPSLQKLSDADNSAFMTTVAELKANNRLKRSIEESKAAEMRALYSGLPVKASEAWVWVPTAWIRGWLTQASDKADRKTIQLCRHNKLSLDAVMEVKRVNQKGIYDIREKLNKSASQSSLVGPPTFASDNLCGDCVKQHCEEMQLKHKMEEQHKKLTKLLKSKCTSSSGYWVGKKSLQNWRRLRLQRLNASYESADMVSAARTSGTESEIKPMDKCSDKAQTSFNADLLCEHGELCLGEGKKRLVQFEVWSILQEHFPSAKAYPALHTVCQSCMTCKNEANKRAELLKSISRLQKEKLSDLYYLKNRPQISKLESEVFVLPTKFVETWSSCIRFPNTYEMPATLCVDLLLCPHDKLSMPLSLDNWEIVSQHVVLVHPKEWYALLQWFTSKESVTISPTEEHVDDNCTSLRTIPEVCKECSRLWKPDLTDKESSTRSYVYVYYPKEIYSEDQVMATMQLFKKRNRRSIPPSAKKIEIEMSESLLQLQVMVMDQYAVTPREQSLYLYGELLQDSEKSLHDLGVESGSVVVLKSMSDKEKIEQFLKETAQTGAATPEDGFRGTGLLD